MIITDFILRWFFLFFFIGGGIPDIQSLNDGTLKGQYTSLQCRSLRIGSYKVMPKERVLIVPQGIRIEVPPIADGKSKKYSWLTKLSVINILFSWFISEITVAKSVTEKKSRLFNYSYYQILIFCFSDSTESVAFDIPIKGVLKILVHFGRSLPVFFVYVKPLVAANIRRLLNMTDKNGYYFDPCSHGMLKPLIKCFWIEYFEYSWWSILYEIILIVHFRWITETHHHPTW